MFRKALQSIIERPWLRIGLAALLLIVGLAPVGAPILSDNELRQAIAAEPSTATTPAYIFRYNNQPDGTAQIQRSASAAQNWVKVAALPETVLQMAASGQKGQQLVFARTSDTIWRSDDAGSTWVKTQGLPSKPLSMAVAKEATGQIMAGTAENGLFLSSDRGESWRPAGGSLSLRGPGTLAVPAVAYNPTDEDVVYATAEMSIATPQGPHSATATFLSPDGGRRWVGMQAGQGTPAAAGSSMNTQLLPTAGRPLAVTVTGPNGAQNFEVRDAQALVSGLSDPDPLARAANAQVIALTGNRSLAPALMPHMRDSDQAAGDRVAEAIGRLGDASAAPGLMDALHDKDAAVRARAAYALGLLKYEPAVSQLARMLQEDSLLARRQAATGLAEMGSPAAVSALMAPLRDQATSASRQAAMQALEEAGNPAVPQLVAALQDHDAVTRSNAAEALGWIRSDQAVAGLSQALKDQDPQVRNQAAWALGEIGTAPAQQALAQAVNSTSDPATRQVQTQALAQAQRYHSERAIETPSRLDAINQALTQIPASRWTLLFLVVVLASILLTLKPQQMQQRRA